MSRKRPPVRISKESQNFSTTIFKQENYPEISGHNVPYSEKKINVTGKLKKNALTRQLKEVKVNKERHHN